jgi:uncharacterized protein (TIGR01777 family)
MKNNLSDKRNILIAGGTGFIGRELTKMLLERGYNVSVLTRRLLKDSNIKYYLWNPDKHIVDDSAFTDTDCIINLTGENIGDKRWNRKQREKIEKSRTDSIKLLTEYAVKYNINTIISASAIGYYGTKTSSTIFNEESEPGDDFLAIVCKKWEEPVNNLSNKDIRTVIVRTGVVLGKNGGTIKKLKPMLNKHIAAIMGSGLQYVPWIHITDLCNIYIKAIEDINMQGVFNATAPEHITNIDFTKALNKHNCKKSVIIRIPGLVFRIAMGKMSSIVLKGSRISSDKITTRGYIFIYNDINSALINLL